MPNDELNPAELRVALRQLRLSRKWSYEALAADMREVLGDRAPALRTLHTFLDGSNSPLETTTYQIREYLKARGAVAA